MPRTIFTEGKHVSFELMMQQVPRNYNTPEEQDENQIHLKIKSPKTRKEVVKNDDVCMAHKSD
jgi:galactokinase/mevalonate kinase-like predicted kinase